MSIVVKDGTVLPDFPDGFVTDEYKYAVIAVNVEDNTDYLAYVTTKPFGYVSDLKAVLSSGTLTNSIRIYTSENNEWLERFSGGASILMEDDQVVVWANHNIPFCTGLDENGNLIISPEIYFKSSIFRLPDGTELPALPDGCFDGTPYGGVLFDGEAYILLTSQSPLFTFDTGDGKSTLFIPVGMIRMYLWVTELAEWMSNGSGEESTPSEFFPLEDMPMVWSNYDLLIATAKNADGSYTIGTEIARKSDENYRVTDGWMRLIANEARRLGNTTDGLTSDDMETVLRAVELSSGGSEIEYPNAMEVNF